jgi:hypothetical protein
MARLAGGIANNPISFGIGAESGYHEYRRPSTRVPTDASECLSTVRRSMARLVAASSATRIVSDHNISRPSAMTVAQQILFRNRNATRLAASPVSAPSLRDDAGWKRKGARSQDSCVNPDGASVRHRICNYSPRSSARFWRRSTTRIAPTHRPPAVPEPRTPRPSSRDHLGTSEALLDLPKT